VADYFVIATGTSSPHLRAMRVALEKELDSRGASILGMDMTSDSGWVVVDADNIMFHLFTKPMREKYALEKLWKDADLVEMEKAG
jgi:ribosome-associated protein